MKIKVKSPKGLWDFIILAWSAYVVFAIVFELYIKRNNATVSLLRLGDTIACGFFFVDVMWRWLASEDKLRFWKWGWIDLIASIPTIDGLRWARLFRVFRIFRVVRGLRSATRILNYFFESKTKATIVIALIMLFGSLLISSICILDIESEHGDIRSISDAVWWAMTTVTTVGYGDKVPLTTEGRAVGIVLMFVGISLFSMTSALIASWLLSAIRKDDEVDLSDKLNALQIKLDKIESMLSDKLID